MARIKRCVYKGCNSDSRYNNKDYMEGVVFYPFPKPKTKLNQCMKWLKWLGRDDYPIERVSYNTYLCSKHFVGGKGPSLNYPDPTHQNEYVSILKKHQCATSNSFLSVNPMPVEGSVTQAAVNPDIIVQVPIEEKEIEVEENFPVNPSIIDQVPIEESEIEAVIDVPTENENSNYVAFFENLALPMNWSITRSPDGFIARKVKGSYFSTIVGVVVNQDFSVTYEALGRPLMVKSILEVFPKEVRNTNDLVSVIKRLDLLKTCQGNTEEDFVNNFKDRSKATGFFSTVTGGVHSERCCLVEMNPKRARCFYCVKQRACLKVLLKRNKKKNDRSLTHFKNLNKNTIISHLKSSKSFVYKLKSKIIRLKKRLAK